MRQGLALTGPQRLQPYAQESLRPQPPGMKAIDCNPVAGVPFFLPQWIAQRGHRGEEMAPPRPECQAKKIGLPLMLPQPWIGKIAHPAAAQVEDGDGFVVAGLAHPKPIVENREIPMVRAERCRIGKA